MPESGVMLLALAILLLILALVGGVLVHPLLFVIALLGVLVLAGDHWGRW